MDPNSKKHVTAENIVSEDIKPEGRTDGPKNFGPEFVTGPGGRLVPTRPAEQVERVARAVAEGARADGKSESEVVRSFAGAMPEGVTPIPASQQPVPEFVVGSMSHADRAEHEEKQEKKYADDAVQRSQYDIGVGLAHEGKALPLEASDALEEGYNDTRASMKEQLQLRRERESENSTLLQHQKARRPEQRPRQQQEQPSRLTVSNPYDADKQAQERAEFDAGANLATEGKTLPDNASLATREGYDAAVAAQGQQQ